MHSSMRITRDIKDALAAFHEGQGCTVKVLDMWNGQVICSFKPGSKGKRVYYDRTWRPGYGRAFLEPAIERLRAVGAKVRIVLFKGTPEQIEMVA